MFMVMDRNCVPGRGGGAGHSQYILVGCTAAHPKGGGGGLRHRHNPKKGVLRHGHNPKKGGLRHGHKSKKGGPKNWSCKKDYLSN